MANRKMRFFSSPLNKIFRRLARISRVAVKLETRSSPEAVADKSSVPILSSSLVTVDDNIPQAVADFNTNFSNKSSPVYLSCPSTFLSQSINYKSRTDKRHATTTHNHFLSSSSSLAQTQTQTQIHSPTNIDNNNNNNNNNTLYSQGANTTFMIIVPSQNTIHTDKERTSALDEMENWDESFDFRAISPQKNGTITSTSTSASTSATLVRPKAHSVSVPGIPISQQSMLPSSSLPSKHENWDDSYVYEDDGDDDEDRDDISSLNNSHPPSVPLALTSGRAASVEDDVESWGSGSDWSGDGDIEDLTRDTFRDGDDTLSSNHDHNASDDLEPQLPTSIAPGHKETRRSAIPRFGRFASARPSPASSNATPTKLSASSNTNASNTSFLAKISPVHRWKSPVRDGPTPKRSQPFQVNRDKTQLPNSNDPSAVSKDLKKERVKKDLVHKSSVNDVKRQSSKSTLSSNQPQQRKDRDREKDQEKEKGTNAMSPIKRVFSGTPLSPKNASSTSKVNNHHNHPSSYSQTSSQSSVWSVSAEKPGERLHERATTSIRNTNPPSAPVSTMTSPTPSSKQGIIASGGAGLGARTKVRYRSKTTTSTTNTSHLSHGLSSPPRAPSVQQPLVKPPPPSSTQNTPAPLPLSPPPAGLIPRSLSQTPRRLSLNDLKLKIPERISHAQRDIKRDMSDVKEFAACVEQIRNLQHVYAIMLRDLRAVLSDPTADGPPTSSQHHNTDHTSTSLLTLSPKKRRGTVASTASPQVLSSALSPSQSHSSPSKAQILKRKFSLAAPPPPQPSAYAVALNRLDNTYGIWWECADVLIELGSGSRGVVDVDEDARDGNSGSGSLSGNALVAAMITGRRTRAVTLGSEVGTTMVGVNVINGNAMINLNVSPASSPNAAQQIQSPDAPRLLPGPPQASPPKPSEWRATTGRAGNGRDLTPRQLAILRDMMVGDEERDGQQWDPKLLDSERGGDGGGGVVDVVAGSHVHVKKRGLREFWSGFRKGGGGGNASTSASDSGNVVDVGSTPSAGSPTRGSASFDSSASESNNNNRGRPRLLRTPSPSKRTVTAASATASGLSRGKKPLHRPSLASIFGIGQKNASGVGVNNVDSPPQKGRGGEGKTDGSSSDWDLMDVETFDTMGPKKVRKDNVGVGANAGVFSRGRLEGVVDDSFSSSSSPEKKTKYPQSQLQAHSIFQVEEEEELEAPSTRNSRKKPSLQLTRAPPSSHVFHSSDEGVSGDLSLRSPIRIHSDVTSARSSGNRGPSTSSTSTSGIPVAKLALTPDNIRPLLRRAREIAAHLNECIGEVRGMMGGVAVI